VGFLLHHKLIPYAVVVDAVLSLDQDDLNVKLIGIKKVTGGALQDSLFVNGVAFKKTFSYAGFEQQPKSFKNPKIVCLNVELELKSEKDNAEVRVEQVSEYQAIVDAEWQIIFNKMEALYKTGAKVVLSKLPIGDLATQYNLNLLHSLGTPLTVRVGTLLTETSSAPAGSHQMIWSA
jgi:T-complex protein 1 subunit eta